MKIGILSMQQITNYGSFLQAYGLKSLIESLGHEVSFINIKPGEQLPQYSIGKLHKLRLLLKRLKVKNPLQQFICTYRIHHRFDKEFKPELGVRPGFDESHYDTIVIGSDEVFNVAQTTWFGFSPQLFGESLNTEKVISYAGSFGATTGDILKELGIDKRIGELMGKIAAISVRDRNSRDTVLALTGKEPSLNIDPVLVYDFGKEIRIPERSDDFLFVYTYPGRMNSPEEISVIKAYAKANNLRIIANANYFDWVDEVVTPHPFEVLGYFKLAHCVVTDTFHGTIMSMKYNKPFAVIVRDMNRNKLTSLLEQFGLTSQLAKEPLEIKGILDSIIDYSTVNKRISDEKDRSLNYLKLNLK